MTTRDDPRRHNKTFDATSAFGHLDMYADELRSALRTIDPAAMEKTFEMLKATMQSGSHIYVAGNGGSAAIADHLCCDWTKGAWHGPQHRLKTQSLVANHALLTAVANDFGYEDSFAAQLEMLASAGAVVVLISSSGKSPNILKAAKTAKTLGLKTVGLSGFTGGELKQMADISLHVDAHNYGIVEDSHQAIMHSLSQSIGIWAKSQASKS